VPSDLLCDSKLHAQVARLARTSRSNPSAGVFLHTPAARVTIMDDDASGGGGGNSTLSLSAIPATIVEASGSINLAVLRSGSKVGAVSVDYATVSGTATAGADFASASGTLHWADGDLASKPIVINITNDTTDESDETFTFTLSNPSTGATLSSNSTATVTIGDDDEPAPPPPAPTPTRDSGGGSSDGLLLGLLLLGLARQFRSERSREIGLR
jgi:hypothetical protein